MIYNPSSYCVVGNPTWDQNLNHPKASDVASHIPYNISMTCGYPTMVFIRKITCLAVALLQTYLYLLWNRTTFGGWQSDKEESVFNRAFGPVMAQRGGILPPFEVVKHNGSLLLGNTHFFTGQMFRLPLNYIQIAGYHIEKKRKPLTKVKNII